MKTQFISLLTGIMILVLTSCAKQPEASFTTDKATYVAGETVHLKNSSVDAKSFLWTMPDGQTSTNANEDFTIDINRPTGTMTFKLDAFSKNEKKDDHTEVTVNVISAAGDVTFWQQSGTGFGTTTVTIGSVTNTISLDYPSEPSCGATGCATFTGIPPGIYSFTATDGNTTWNGTFSSEPGCQVFLLN